MKLTRDPITLQPAIKIHNQTIALQKGTTIQDLKEKPLKDTIECAI